MIARIKGRGNKWTVIVQGALNPWRLAARIKHVINEPVKVVNETVRIPANDNDHAIRVRDAVDRVLAAE